MSMNEQMEESEASILHTYNRFPVVFEKGEGCYLYDSEGKEYLDFAAGIAVNALGYHYPGYDEALKSQIDKLMHISNLYSICLPCKIMPGTSHTALDLVQDQNDILLITKLT